MQHVTHWIQNECKSSEESDEWDNASVEKLFIAQNVGKLGVQHGETNSHGQIHPCFQEWDNFSSRTWSCNYKYILGITKDSVVEQNAATT
jgi:hypothetical protein